MDQYPREMQKLNQIVRAFDEYEREEAEKKK